MLKAVPPLLRKRGPRIETRPATIPTTLTLIAARLDVDGGVLILTFDQAIDISAYDGSAVVVDDAANHAQYLADTEVQRIDARSFQASLDYVGPTSATRTQLTAGAPTGVVAVEGGLMWAGVTALVLPFPS